MDDLTRQMEEWLQLERTKSASPDFAPLIQAVQDAQTRLTSARARLQALEDESPVPAGLLREVLDGLNGYHLALAHYSQAMRDWLVIQAFQSRRDRNE